MEYKHIFTAADGSAEIFIMLESSGGRADKVLDTFWKKGFVDNALCIVDELDKGHIWLELTRTYIPKNLNFPLKIGYNSGCNVKYKTS